MQPRLMLITQAAPQAHARTPHRTRTGFWGSGYIGKGAYCQCKIALDFGEKEIIIVPINKVRP